MHSTFKSKVSTSAENAMNSPQPATKPGLHRAGFSPRKLLRHALSLIPKRLRYQIIRGVLAVDLSPPPELTVSLAQTKEDLESALSILHDSYVSEGLMKP